MWLERCPLRPGCNKLAGGISGDPEAPLTNAAARSECQVSTQRSTHASDPRPSSTRRWPPLRRGNRMQVDNDRSEPLFNHRVSSVSSFTHIYNVFLRSEFEPCAPRRPDPGVRASPSALASALDRPCAPHNLSIQRHSVASGIRPRPSGRVRP